MLLSLEHDLLRALFDDGWDKVKQHVDNLQHYWYLRLETFFSEFPGGRRPLSTTWPWSIRPSLAVLWGVCWMFHAGTSADDFGNIFDDSGNIVDDDGQILFDANVLGELAEYLNGTSESMYVCAVYSGIDLSAASMHTDTPNTRAPCLVATDVAADAEPQPLSGYYSESGKLASPMPN